MPGSRDHGERTSGNPLDALKDEVQGTLKLLFRHVEQQSINLDIAADFTAYQTGFPCDVESVDLNPEEIAVSTDPIAILNGRVYATTAIDTLPEAQLSENAPCRIDPVACHEPVLEALQFDSLGIAFENVALTESREMPPEPVATKAHGLAVQGFDPPSSKNVSSESFKAKTYSLGNPLSKVRTLNTPRFYALPIKKTPIPPHRFPAELKELFREKLAEKAKTVKANVQLRIVYERMDMSLYAGIEQDAHGNLLCTPKNELLGRNAATHAAQALRKTAPAVSAYLVFGTRLDNKEDIRALVPYKEEAGQ